MNLKVKDLIILPLLIQFYQLIDTMKPDFNNMTKDELREYVITHQDDKEAFYIYIDRLKSNPSNKVYSNSLSPQEIDKIVTNHLKEKQSRGL